MSRSDWKRLQILFERALDHPPAERLAWLEQACEGDDDLLHEMRALLCAHAQNEADDRT